MAFTPAHLQIFSRNDLFQDWRQDVIQVKQLYLEGRYKRCAELCETLQDAAKHLIHKAFLYFFQAICYESLGIAAHDYSSNRVLLLQHAEDSFALALQVLPQAYASTDCGQPYTPKTSPEYATMDILKQYESPGTLSQEVSPCPFMVGRARPRSDSTSSTYSDINEAIPLRFDTPDFASYSPRQEVGHEAALHLQTPLVDTPAKRRRTSKARLSQSLSSSHILVENLIPSPLSRITRCVQSIEPVSTSRLLPPLPFNHKPIFQLKGGRQVLISTRKSAIQTLVARFEGAVLDVSSPSTPRFNKISQAFSPIYPHPHFESYLTSASLARYNHNLSSFRDQLSVHVNAIGKRIDDTLEIQQQHKIKKDNRMASFWSFKPTVSLGDGDPVITARKQRIARLKAQGWPVSKESHGWKGQDHYDRLRRQAEVELY